MPPPPGCLPGIPLSHRALCLLGTSTLGTFQTLLSLLVDCSSYQTRSSSMVIFAWHLFTNAYLLVWMSSQRPGEGPGASPRTKGDRIFARVLKFHNRYTMDSRPLPTTGSRYIPRPDVGCSRALLVRAKTKLVM